MRLDELIDAVAARTQGTKSDPLTRDDIEQVVRETLALLIANSDVEIKALADEGSG